MSPGNCQVTTVSRLHHNRVDMPRHALSIYTFAEIGVILLMFGVGLHFHFDELLAVRGVAFPGALGQTSWRRCWAVSRLWG